MATMFTVTSATDDPSDAGSLRAQLAQAQDGDTIVFDPSINGKTIVLNSTLDVTHGVTIDGGTSGVAISHVAFNPMLPPILFPDFTVAVTGTTPATIKNLAINDGIAKGARGATGAAGATGMAGQPGEDGKPGEPGGSTGGGVYVKSGSLVLTNDSFANDVGLGGTGGNGGAGGLAEPGGQNGTKGAGGQGGNAAGAVYVESGATVTASNLTFVHDSMGGDTNHGVGGQGGVGPQIPSGTSYTLGPPGQGFDDSNDPGVVAAATCYCSGTLIRTARGDIAVEDLAAGDIAVTVSGEERPIRWIGSRMIDCAAHARPSEVWPIRIHAGAFGANRPERTLHLSPGHPVLVGADTENKGGHLVPIMCLLNGTTIERAPCDEVTYWHVELDAHDILLAEGLPAESYLDWGDRAFFAEGVDHALQNPDFVVPGLAARCRPVAIDGPVVEAERRRLDMVFATRLARACAWPSETDIGAVVDVARD